MNSYISIYIHYPFCESKCNYCDFNSYSFKMDEELLIKSYLKELEFYRIILQNRFIQTIYFGGGTPSLMSNNLVEKIFKKLIEYKIMTNAEITFEANPNSISLEKLKFLKEMGINRISLGVQSFDNDVLKFLGRIHDKEQAIKSIENVARIFNNFSIDLIYAFQGQTLNDWKETIEQALKFNSNHMSAYQLLVENGTYFSRHKIKNVNDDLGVRLYNLTGEILSKNGLNFYEISSYAKNGSESKHNLVYWNSGEWVGIGASAHGRININNKRYATQNIKNPIRWCDKIKEQGKGVSMKKHLTFDEIRTEKIIMGLRTIYGIDDYKDLKLNNLEMLQKNNLIKIKDNNLSLTKEGFLLLNSIIEKIV